MLVSLVDVVNVETVVLVRRHTTELLPERRVRLLLLAAAIYDSEPHSAVFLDGVFDVDKVALADNLVVFHDIV